MELSEEEKKAIETLEFFKKKKWYKYAGDRGTEILDEDEKKDVDIVLNLIEKQQKEIDRLNRKQADDEMLKDTFIERDYISKDKIRELIKKWVKDDTFFDFSDTYDVEIFEEELLEEN